MEVPFGLLGPIAVGTAAILASVCWHVRRSRAASHGANIRDRSHLIADPLEPLWLDLNWSLNEHPDLDLALDGLSRILAEPGAANIAWALRIEAVDEEAASRQAEFRAMLEDILRARPVTSPDGLRMYLEDLGDRAEMDLVPISR